MSKMLLARLISLSVDVATIEMMVGVMLPGSLSQGTYLLGMFLWVKESFLINILHNTDAY